MTATAPPVAAAVAETGLDTGGMTCASCVGRVQKALQQVDGVVAASAKLDSETARVTHDPALASFGRLAAAVTRAGYTARRRGHREDAAEQGRPAERSEGDADRAHDREIDRLGRRWVIALT